MLRLLAELFRALAQLSKPTIARVHGAALGGGTDWSPPAIWHLATPQASFGTTEVRLGLTPSTIAPYLITAIGERAAHRYFLTGERFDGEVAQRLGLVNEVCAAEQLDERMANSQVIWLRAALPPRQPARGSLLTLATVPSRSH